MHLECHKSQFIPGEPHLGTVEECNIIAEDKEIAELIWEAVSNSYEVPCVVFGFDVFTDDPIDIDVDEWFGKGTVEKLEDWLHSIPEDDGIEEEKHVNMFKDILGI